MFNPLIVFSVATLMSFLFSFLFMTVIEEKKRNVIIKKKATKGLFGCFIYKKEDSIELRTKSEKLSKFSFNLLYRELYYKLNGNDNKAKLITEKIKDNNNLLKNLEDNVNYIKEGFNESDKNDLLIKYFRELIFSLNKANLLKNKDNIIKIIGENLPFNHQSTLIESILHKMKNCLKKTKRQKSD